MISLEEAAFSFATTRNYNGNSRIITFTYVVGCEINYLIYSKFSSQNIL